MIDSFQIQFYVYSFFSLSYFLSEIIEYKTIIIESAAEIPRKKQQHPSRRITKHFNIITTNDNAINSEKNNKNDNIDDDETIEITNVQIEPIVPTPTTVIQAKEVVSYQRFGRVDKKTVAYPFKCHLCGFSCRFKESLLSHFDQVHPQ